MAEFSDHYTKTVALVDKITDDARDMLANGMSTLDVMAQFRQFLSGYTPGQTATFAATILVSIGTDKLAREGFPDGFV